MWSCLKSIKIDKICDVMWWQGGHKPRKPGKLKEFEELLKTQGNWNFSEKRGNSGKCEISDIITNENAFHWIFLCKVSQGQFWKLPENVRENSGILGSQRCGHPGWTSDSKQPLNILCLGKYLSKSFETLCWNYKISCLRPLKKLGCHGNYVILGHFNGYHEMKHNSASPHQNQLEFWNQNSRGEGL